MRVIPLAVVIRADKVLLGRVAKTDHKYDSGIFYVFPGGGMEAGELEEDTVRRESLEEAGIRVRVMEKIGGRYIKESNTELAFWACEMIDGDLEMGDKMEVEEWMWVSLDELVKYSNQISQVVVDYLQDKFNEYSSIR